MELTDLQRLKKLVKWLIFLDFGDNEREIAELLGYKKSSFSQIMNGKVPISDKFIDKIASIDNNINKDWIKTGEGQMLKDEKKEHHEDPVLELGKNDKYTQLLEENNTLLKAQLKDKEEKEALYKENKIMLERENKRLKTEIERLKGKDIYKMEGKIESQRLQIESLRGKVPL